MSTFTIGQVAKRTGFTASALRYYEDVGLVTPTTRTDAGYRIYDDDAVSRLAFIARAKQLGCSLEEITDLLEIWDGDRCAPVQHRFHELVTEKIRATQEQIVELVAFGSQLQTAAARLGAPSIDGRCDDACACVAGSDGAITPPTAVVVSSESSSDSPIACTLRPDEIPDRIANWNAVLASARERSTTTTGRLRVELDRNVDVAELARLVAAEQACCSFFSFALTIDERGVALEVGAPDGATEIVDTVFGKLTTRRELPSTSARGGSLRRVRGRCATTPSGPASRP